MAVDEKSRPLCAHGTAGEVLLDGAKVGLRAKHRHGFAPAEYGTCVDPILYRIRHAHHQPGPGEQSRCAYPKL